MNCSIFRTILDFVQKLLYNAAAVRYALVLIFKNQYYGSISNVKFWSYLRPLPCFKNDTVNFRTRKKSYKCKKKMNNPKSDWAIFENTHEAIILKEDFDLVQELRKNKRRIQKCEEVNPFSGIVYCADCGKKMYLCRSKRLNSDQEHLKCSTYSADSVVYDKKRKAA